MKQFKFWGIAGLTVLLSACSSDPLDVDASGVKLDVTYLNLDSVLVHTPNAKREEKLAILSEGFSKIIEYQTAYCFRVGVNPTTTMEQDLDEFYKNPYVKRLEKRIGEKFSALPKNHEAIVEGFKHIKYHLPKAKIPSSIVYTNSYFASSAFCTETDICMGLERYLGEKTDVIAELPNDQFYQYIKHAMDPKYLERDAVCAWVLTHIVPEKEDAYTIEAMITWGKILYLTEAAFPEKPKEDILRHSKKDYDWELANERAFWDYLVKNKLLYSKSEDEKQNFLHEAPFTAGLPLSKQAPDRLGQFLGWRIVHSYMEQYEVTLQELMNVPYTTLLQEYEISD